jgi:DNA-binding NarL/FixJ family response regulator
VLIADDHELLRTGIRAMLASEPDLEVVGEAKDGAEALALCRELRPELVLMDLSMPNMDGLEATRAIKEAWPKVSVLILTAHADQEMLLDAVRAGAAGYVLEGVGPDELVGAVRATLGGSCPWTRSSSCGWCGGWPTRSARGRTKRPRTERSPSPSRTRPASSRCFLTVKRLRCSSSVIWRLDLFAGSNRSTSSASSPS